MPPFPQSDLPDTSGSLFTAAAEEHARVCMLADTLAWAVSHHIPLPDAVRTLPLSLAGPGASRSWHRYLARWLADVIHPWRIRPPMTRAIRWRWRLDELADLLEQGIPLSGALERSAGHIFPAFFITAVAHAERNGILDTALPALARQLRIPIVSARQRAAHLTYQASRVFSTLAIFIFLIANVVPKMLYIMADLGNVPPPGEGPQRIEAFMEWSPLFLLALFAALFLLISDRFGEFVALRFPLLGRQRKRWLLYELAASLAAFLRQGADLVTAAEWSVNATRSSWMRRRILQFIEALRGGRGWMAAWQDIGLTTPLELWILRQASRREDPAGGFELVAEWGARDFEQRARRLDQWLDPICTLILGALVGALAVWSWSAIIRCAAPLL